VSYPRKRQKKIDLFSVFFTFKLFLVLRALNNCESVFKHFFKAVRVPKTQKVNSLCFQLMTFN